MTNEKIDMCPCGSGKKYADCCEPVITGKTKDDDEEDENDEPITAEEPVQKPVREVTKATEDIAYLKEIFLILN